MANASEVFICMPLLRHRTALPSMNFLKSHLILMVFFVCCLFGVVRRQQNGGDRNIGRRHEHCACGNDDIDDWPRANRFATECRPGIAVRFKRLVLANASSDDPEVIRLARDVIVKPMTKRASGSWIKHSLPIEQTPQAAYIDKITGSMRNGFFVECGAYDGERSSNTAWLERYRNWIGLLIEADPYFYTQLLGKNRRVWSANVCLSPVKRITMLPFRDSAGQIGQLAVNGLQPPVIESRPISYRNRDVPCFPLESLLLALNRTRIDYLSLDVEGLELDILETVPWTRFDIRTMSIEHKHVPRGKQSILDHVTKQGYQLVADLHSAQSDRMVFVDDFVFAKPGVLLKSHRKSNKSI